MAPVSHSFASEAGLQVQAQRWVMRNVALLTWVPTTPARLIRNNDRMTYRPQPEQSSTSPAPAPPLVAALSWAVPFCQNELPATSERDHTEVQALSERPPVHDGSM